MLEAKLLTDNPLTDNSSHSADDTTRASKCYGTHDDHDVMMMTFLKSMVDAYAKKSQQQPPF